MPAPTATEEFLRGVEPRLRAAVRRHVPEGVRRSFGEDDLLQEARLAALAAAAACDRRAFPGVPRDAFVSLCVRRRLRCLARRECRRTRPIVPGDPPDVAPPVTRPPDLPDVTSPAVRGRLGWRERVVTSLIWREGLTVVEAGAALGVTRQTVEYDLRRARETLSAPPRM